MTDSPPLPRRVAWFAPWTWKRRCVVLAALPPFLAYPFSIGPAYWLFANGCISYDAIKIAYSPLLWLAAQSSAVVFIMDWYVGLFVPF